MENQLTLRLPPALGRALARQARARGVPRSQLVREAVARYLATGTEPAPAPDAAWERVAPLVGSLALDRAAVEADRLARRIRRHNWRQ
jgi:predicted transcriptional regulator